MAEPETPKEPTQAEREAKLREQYDIEESPSTVAPVARQEPAPTPPALAPSHPNYLVEQARDFGLSDAEIAEMPTDQLGRSVRLLTKQAMAYHREMSQARTFEQPRQAPAPEPPPPPDPLDNILDDDGKPIAHDQLNSVSRTMVQELKALRAEVAGLKGIRGEFDNYKATNDAERADAVFNKHSDIFGQGAWHEVDKQSSEWFRRQKMMSDAIAHSKQTGVPVEKCLARLIGVMYGTAKPQAPKEPTADPSAVSQPARQIPPKDPVTGRFTRQEWADAGLAAPVSRNGAAQPNGRDKAIKNLGEQLQQYDTGGDADMPEGSVPE